MKNEPTKQDRIKIAINDVQKCMIDSLEASQLLIDVSKRQNSARYALLQAKDRLRAIEQEILSEM